MYQISNPTFISSLFFSPLTSRLRAQRNLFARIHSFWPSTNVYSNKESFKPCEVVKEEASQALQSPVCAFIKSLFSVAQEHQLASKYMAFTITQKIPKN